MADDAENHTIKLLQEMRAEMRAGFSDVNERFDDVNTRIDGLSHIVTLLAANMGGHDQRIEDLETAVSKLSKD
jgi:archaellum component FlaC